MYVRNVSSGESPASDDGSFDLSTCLPNTSTTTRFSMATSHPAWRATSSLSRSMNTYSAGSSDSNMKISWSDDTEGPSPRNFSCPRSSASG